MSHTARRCVRGRGFAPTGSEAQAQVPLPLSLRRISKLLEVPSCRTGARACRSPASKRRFQTRRIPHYTRWRQQQRTPLRTSERRREAVRQLRLAAAENAGELTAIGCVAAAATRAGLAGCRSHRVQKEQSRNSGESDYERSRHRAQAPRTRSPAHCHGTPCLDVTACGT